MLIACRLKKVSISNLKVEIFKAFKISAEMGFWFKNIGCSLKLYLSCLLLVSVLTAEEES